MPKIGNVLNALAIGIGGAAQGYGEGLLKVAFMSREDYYNRLREERSAAREAAQTSGMQAFQKEMAGETREFQREMSDTEWEREKEKMGMQEASAEKKLRFAASLRPKGSGSGGGGSATTAELKEVEYLTNLMTREAGLKEPTDEIRMKAYREVNQRKGASGGGKEPAAWELQKRIAAGELGRDPTDAEVAARFKKESGEKVGAAQYLQMLQAEEKAYRGEIENMDATQEEATAAATERVNAKLDAMGVEYPRKAATLATTKTKGSTGSWDYQGSAEPASESDQESVSEVEQPGVLNAPATSGLGDKPQAGTPKGAGTERSPFIVDTLEEQEWFLNKAPEGSWVIYKGRKAQK